MTGMKRDILLRLCRLMRFRADNIEAVIGMCVEHFVWKTHVHFISGRRRYTRHTFIPSWKTVRYTFPNGTQHWNTIFLKEPITTGISRWTVRIEYGNNSYFSLGTMPSGDKGKSSWPQPSETATMYWFGRHPDKSLCSRLNGMGLGRWTGYSCPRCDELVPDNAYVTVEANVAAHTLCFFINGVKVCNALSNVYFPAYMGLSGFNYPNSVSSCESLSLVTLSAPTPSPIICRYYKALYTKTLYNKAGK